MWNFYQSSQFNDKNAFTKFFFPDFSCTQRHMCVHARYIPGSRNSWCVPGPSFIQVKFCFRKRTAGTNFFVYSWIKGRIASIIIQVWQLLHKMPVLCLKILTPPHMCVFKIDPPKLSLFENCTPLCDVVNDRSLHTEKILFLTDYKVLK